MLVTYKFGRYLGKEIYGNFFFAQNTIDFIILSFSVQISF